MGSLERCACSGKNSTRTLGAGQGHSGELKSAGGETRELVNACRHLPSRPTTAWSPYPREDRTVAQTSPLNLGFLTVLHEPSGYLGGYLVTNAWGRPLEFRVSTAVQPNRVQQILYGGTLQPYICADLIGKTLLDKTGVPAQLILTDHESVLDLRLRVETPVAWLAGSDDPLGKSMAESNVCVRPASGGQGPILCHPRHPGDVPLVREMLDSIDGVIDLAEPFTRIREAIAEARKLGVTKSA